jgi:hypothetical protein
MTLLVAIRSSSLDLHFARFFSACGWVREDAEAGVDAL